MNIPTEAVKVGARAAYLEDMRQEPPGNWDELLASAVFERIARSVLEAAHPYLEMQALQEILGNLFYLYGLGIDDIEKIVRSRLDEVKDR